MKQLSKMFLLVFLLLSNVFIKAQGDVNPYYLTPSNVTIHSNETVEIFSRISITGITSVLGNTGLITATLVITDASLSWPQNDPRWNSTYTIPTLFNQQVGTGYEYKATIQSIPVGNYNYCYLYVYNGTTYYGYNYGDGAYFYPGYLHIVSPALGAEKSDELYPDFKLLQNYPNPFNPATTIFYEVPFSSKVSVIVYDLLGREIEKLVNEEKSPGMYKINFEVRNLPSGVYLCRIAAGTKSKTNKMVLLK